MGRESVKAQSVLKRLQCEDVSSWFCYLVPVELDRGSVLKWSLTRARMQDPALIELCRRT
jgi:hypothetical protein